MKKHLYDDLCMGLLFQAVLRMHMGKYAESEATFHALFDVEKKIELDHYVAPFAHYECGKLYCKMGDKEKAKHEFRGAVNHYKHYSNESRLHFLVQSQLASLDESLADNEGAE